MSATRRSRAQSRCAWMPLTMRHLMSAEYLRSLGAEPVTYGHGLTDRVRELGGSPVTAALDLRTAAHPMPHVRVFGRERRPQPPRTPTLRRLTCEKRYVQCATADGAGEHCESGARTHFHQHVFDWLDKTLSALPTDFTDLKLLAGGHHRSSADPTHLSRCYEFAVRDTSSTYPVPACCL